MDELDLLTADEVIAELRISRSTLDRLLANGEITAQRIGSNGALRFKRGDVQSALQPRTTTPGRAPMTHGQIRGTGGFRGMKRG